MKIISLIFLFGLTVIAYGANLSLVDCTSGMGRVQNALVDNIEYTEFILKDKDIGCWSGDKGPRAGAPYWERIEYGQKDEDTLSKNKTHVIYFRVKFEEGFVGRKETFFQIHMYNKFYTDVPPMMLMWSLNNLIVAHPAYLKDLAKNWETLNWKVTDMYNDKSLKPLLINNYYNQWMNFRIKISPIVEEFGTVSITLNGKLIYFNPRFYIPTIGTPRIKYGIYRPGNENGNKTSKVLYSPIIINSE
jgi:hypothetical protein